ncbi:CBS domain-containing protein [Salinibaculum salinum]|uniref:CBS domain-containing protein n=1 Tax=Salinibaculum salinum TaxID=3131996 RepID=UPI0030EF2863
MLVEDLMQTDIVTSDIEETVRGAVEQMLRNHVGSVVVVNNGNPTGIVTETDILKVGYGTESCFGDIPLELAMSQPLVTIAPDKSLRAAMRTMRTENIKKLPVQDGIDLVGILTMVDITREYNDIVKEIHAMEQPAGLSEAELRGLSSRRE